MTPLDPHQARAQVFERHRRQLEGIAYRMMGSRAEAQDLVQETYLRFQATTAEIQSPRAWLVTVCVRLASNALGSARARRELYVGPWLPEPVLTSAPESDQEARLALDQSLSLALLVALEELRPAERAAFLLHEVFDYDFDQIGLILGRSNAACRKLASRARSVIRRRKGTPTPRPEHEGVVLAFLSALREGRVDAIEVLLAPEARLVADGGGKASTTVPLNGSRAIAKFYRGLFETERGLEARAAWVNGEPGLVVLEEGRLTTALAFEVASGKIQTIWAQRNPDKLPVSAPPTELGAKVGAC